MDERRRMISTTPTAVPRAQIPVPKMANTNVPSLRMIGLVQDPIDHRTSDFETLPYGKTATELSCADVDHDGEGCG
jgi:hypothetical protein